VVLGWALLFVLILFNLKIKRSNAAEDAAWLQQALHISYSKYNSNIDVLGETDDDRCVGVGVSNRGE
jgi:hypothetical protein